MPTWNIPALLFAVTLSLAMAIVGGLLTGNQLTQWFATLYKPRFQLFRWHNTFTSFLGVVIFLIPLTILQVTLVLVDHVSAWLVLVYLLWVIGYDIPWAYRLWQLNPPQAQPA